MAAATTTLKNDGGFPPSPAKVWGGPQFHDPLVIRTFRTRMEL
jgi:hypothetical protein